MGSCPDTDIDPRICLTIKALRLVINFFICMIVMSDSAVLLLGEIRCWSLGPMVEKNN